MDLDKCLERLAGSDEHLLKPPSGIPSIPATVQLPDDVRAFYERAGGAMLFQQRDFSIEVVPAAEFVRANPIIRLCDGEYDISFDWFIIARSGRTQYVTIDCNPQRLGHCYDSFWDVHALRGDSRVIAVSFTEFLDRFLNNTDDIWYWTRDDFVPHGDAYDGIPE